MLPTRPDVCVIRWRTVTADFAGRVCDVPGSISTLGEPNVGKISAMGVSRASFPSSISNIAAAPVTSLVIEYMRHKESGSAFAAPFFRAMWPDETNFGDSCIPTTATAPATFFLNTYSLISAFRRSVSFARNS